MEELKRVLNSVLRHGSTYFLASVIAKLAAFGLLPIIMRKLSPAEYGLYTNAISLSQVLLSFATLKVDAAYNRVLYDYISNRQIIGSLTTTLFTFMLIWNFLFIPISLTITYFTFIGWGISDWRLPSLTIGLVIFHQFSTIAPFYLRAREKSLQVIILTEGTTIFGLLLGTALIVLTKASPTVLLCGPVFASGVALIVGILLLYKDTIIYGSWRKDILARCLRFGTGMLPMSFSTLAIHHAQRYIIAGTIGLGAVGIYAFHNQLAALLQIVYLAIDRALRPQYMQLLHSANDGNHSSINNISTIIQNIIVSMLVLYVGLCVCGPPIFKLLFPSEYSIDSRLLGLLSMGYVILALRKQYSVIAAYHDRTWSMSLVTIVCAIFSVVANLIFIQIFGVIAAGFIMVFTLLLNTAAFIKISKSVVIIPFRKLTINILFITAFSIVLLIPDSTSLEIRITITLLYGLTTFLLNFNNRLLRLIKYDN